MNGRFLRGPITGTARVAQEILSCWDDAIAQDDPRFRGSTVEVLAPPDIRRSLELRAIPTRIRSVVGGGLWELVDLGLLSRTGVLVNFANIAPLAHPKSITYLHDAQVFLFPQSYSAWQRRTHQPLARLAGHGARRVITVSDFSKQMLRRFKLAPADRIAVIHNGADHILRTSPDPSVLERFGLARHGYVLMYGSPFAYKNTQVVYEAFRGMAADAPKLAVVARADARSEIGVPEGLGDQLVLMSGIDDRALRALYENALAFLQPAKTEGFAMTQLEALNCGSPVITSPTGSMPEVLHEGALYADPDSPDQWRAAILGLQHDPALRAAMVAKGQAVSARYTWRQAADALWEQVADVAGG